MEVFGQEEGLSHDPPTTPESKATPESEAERAPRGASGEFFK